MTTIDLIALILTLALITPLFIAMVSLAIYDLAPENKIPKWLEDFADKSADMVDKVLSAILFR